MGAGTHREAEMKTRKLIIGTIGMFIGIIVAMIGTEDLYLIKLAGVACWSSAILMWLPEKW